MDSLMAALLNLIPAHVIVWLCVLFILASFLVYKMRHYTDSEPLAEMERLASELQETVQEFADFSARVDSVCAEVDRGDREAYKRICGIQMDYIQIQSKLASHDKVKQGMVKAYLQHCSKVKQQLQISIAQHSLQEGKSADESRSRPRSATTEPARSTTNAHGSRGRREPTFRPCKSLSKCHKIPETVKSFTTNNLLSTSNEKLRPGISRKSSVINKREASPEIERRSSRVVTPIRSNRSASTERKSPEESKRTGNSRSGIRREKDIIESKDNKDCLVGSLIHRAQIGTKNCHLYASRGRNSGLSFTLEEQRHGERSSLEFNAAVAAEFSRQLALNCDLLSRLQPANQAAALKRSAASIKSFTINSGAGRYYMDLKESQRGRFLSLSHRRPTSPTLVQLAIPAKHMPDLRNHLDLVLTQCATD